MMKKIKWVPFGLSPLLFPPTFYFEIISRIVAKDTKVPILFILLLLVVTSHITVVQVSKSEN